MEIILAIGAAFLFLATLFMPWINRHRFHSLKDDFRDLTCKIKTLEDEVMALRKSQSSNPQKTIAADADVPKIVDEKVEKQPQDINMPEEKKEALSFEPLDDLDTHINVATHVPKESFNFEKQFGAKLPVWRYCTCLGWILPR